MKQISIFAENKMGSMQEMTQVLKDADINIVSMLTNDSAEFGIIRLLVDQPDKAAAAFKAAGYLVKEDQVIAIYMEDKPGYLNGILEALRQSNINIDYLYISFDRSDAAPIAVIKVDEQDVVEMCLRSKGCRLL